jgi:hypothetical protein
MTVLEIQVELGKLLEQVKKTAYVEGYEATDEEALGIVISKYFEWNGKKVLQASFFALEDANYHREAKSVEEMIEALG